MDAHLRFSGRTDAEQREALIAIIRGEPLLLEVLTGMRAEGLNDWLLVAGAIYNVAWNVLTGRPPLNGIKDIDAVYFDDSDLSYEAEDRVIRRLAARFAHLPLTVEVRNQARVHLWFPQKFNQPFAPLTSSAEMLTLYASKTHAVAARLEADDTIALMAPFGLDDLFSFRMVPNRALPGNAPTHQAKGTRAKAQWPELTLLPW